jgi:hypothetical protein
MLIPLATPPLSRKITDTTKEGTSQSMRINCPSNKGDNLIQRDRSGYGTDRQMKHRNAATIYFTQNATHSYCRGAKRSTITGSIPSASGASCYTNLPFPFVFLAAAAASSSAARSYSPNHKNCDTVQTKRPKACLGPCRPNESLTPPRRPIIAVAAT